MVISKDGLDLIEFFESLSLVPYICPAGYWTIGWGHLIRPGEEFTEITEDEADQLLRLDVHDAERAVNRLIRVELEQHQFDALVSFTFNAGGGALQSSTLRRCVNREDHQAAADQFLRWKYAKGVVQRGLVLRRMAERLMYLG